MAITWRDAMTTGVAGLDSDHKQLIALINGVEDTLSGSATGPIGSALTELIAYTESHFAREEKILFAFNVPGYDEHVQLHRALAAKARTLESKFKSAPNDDERRKVGSVLNLFLKEWLLTHILKEDLKVKPFVPSRPSPSQQIKPLEWSLEKPTQVEAPKPDKNKDIEYNVPPELQRLLKRIEYVVPDVPPPDGDFESFEKLCEASINRRIDKVLIFFQRHNPDVDRKLPPFFLASPAFAQKFHAAVVKFIFPVIWESRQIRMLSTNFDWANSDTESFWFHVSKQLQQVILEGWNSGWDDLKLIESKKPDGTRTYQVKPNLKELREMLQPDNPLDYDIPKVTNRDIETFKSLLDPYEDKWDLLNNAWRICHDLYEQEKDPRVFQQKAREGALRDNLISAFSKYPEQWADFLVLACHRVFPRLTTSFLKSFTRNFGRNDAEREVHLPYTMRYLAQVAEHPEITRQEEAEEAEWQEQMKLLSDFIRGRIAE